MFEVEQTTVSPGREKMSTEERMRRSIQRKNERVSVTLQKLQEHDDALAQFVTKLNMNPETSVHPETSPKYTENPTRLQSPVHIEASLDLIKEEVKSQHAHFQEELENESLQDKREVEIEAEKEVERTRCVLLAEEVAAANELEAKAQRVLEEEEVKHAERRAYLSHPRVPASGFVLKSFLQNGSKIFVNLCSHVDVSDVISSQGRIGSPYMICHKCTVSANVRSKGDAEAPPPIIYDVIIHAKYMAAILGEYPQEKLKLKMAMHALEHLNSQVFHKTSPIDLTNISFPKTANNYKGASAPGAFTFPLDMPHRIVFDGIEVVPNPGLSLKCQAMNTLEPIWINICYDDHVPEFLDMHMIVGDTLSYSDIVSECLIVDVLIHPSVWFVASKEKNEKMYAKMMHVVGETLDNKLDANYRIETEFAYKGGDVRKFPLSELDLSLTEIPAGLFSIKKQMSILKPEDRPTNTDDASWLENGEMIIREDTRVNKRFSPKKFTQTDNRILKKCDTMQPARRATFTSTALRRTSTGKSLTREGKQEHLIATPGFVVKSAVSDGSKIFVNVCSHVAVSDVISSQGIIGSPYMICHISSIDAHHHHASTDTSVSSECSSDTANLLIYDVVVNTKYIHAVYADCSENMNIRRKMAGYALEFVNTAFFNSDLRIDKHILAFPLTSNNYKGPLVKRFTLPASMPDLITFQSVVITPNPIISLKTKKVETESKVFVNLCHHKDIPCYSTGELYLSISNERILRDKSNAAISVFDAYVHTSVFSLMKIPEEEKLRSEVYDKAILSTEKVLGEQLVKEYTTPMTKNDYKGDDVVEYEVVGTEIAKTKLPSKAFIDAQLPLTSENLEKKEKHQKRRAKSNPLTHGAGGTVTSMAVTMAAAATSLKPDNSILLMKYQRWSTFLLKDEQILVAEQLTKNGSLGFTSKKVQLILTDTPRLFYIDSKTLKCHSDIDWRPNIVVVSESTFKISAKDGKFFTFIDDANGAVFWENTINSTGT